MVAYLLKTIHAEQKVRRRPHWLLWLENCQRSPVAKPAATQRMEVGHGRQRFVDARAQSGHG